MKQINKIFMNKNFAVVLYIVIAMGIVLMLLPGNESRVAVKEGAEIIESEEKENSSQDTERRLEQLLSLSEGAGRVKVMITYKNNGNLIVAENKTREESTDDTSNRQSSQTDVVLSNENMPVILSEYSPEIEGVVIVAEGGGNIQVKNSLISATQALLGVEPHKIEVLKMKTEG